MDTTHQFQSTERPILCADCGSENLYPAKYCTSCGKKFGDSDESKVNTLLNQIENNIQGVAGFTSQNVTHNDRDALTTKDTLINLMTEYIKTLQDSKHQLVDIMRQEMHDIKQLNSEPLKTTNHLRSDMERLRSVIYPAERIEGLEEIEEEIKHYTSIRKELIKRLRAMEIEQAKKGLDTPAHIENQIVDLKQQINETEARIKILSYDSEHIKTQSKAQE